MYLKAGALGEEGDEVRPGNAEEEEDPFQKP
jgi:hypothetical protein